MRALIVADIHSNLEALTAVLADAEIVGFDEIWCLGDIVGYGPNPGECIELLSGYELVSIVGNHDLAAIDRIDVTQFNSYAATAALWTRHQLSDAHTRYIARLNSVERRGQFTLTHGSLREPVWEYLVNRPAAEATFALADTPHILVGHSHLQFVCVQGASNGAVDFVVPTLGEPTSLDGARAIAHPGSVGQPRDGDARAAYAIYDTATNAVAHQRVEYDIELTQAKMRQAGLPAYLSDRLAIGR